MLLVAVSAANIVPQTVVVIDGDTLRLNAQRVRLYGIDAPEAEQTCLNGNARFWDCGKAATGHLRTLVTGKTVLCVEVNRDVYHRSVATCSADGVELGEAMVEAGLAVDVGRYSRGRYRAAENEARAAGRGIWSGTFQQPKAWRAEHRN